MSTQNKFTPGPWVNNGCEHVEAKASGEIVAKLYDWQGDAERLANAQLVAAAPDMLAALKTAAECLSTVVRLNALLKTGQTSGGPTDTLSAAADTANFGLSKVEGVIASAEGRTS